MKLYIQLNTQLSIFNGDTLYNLKYLNQFANSNLIKTYKWSELIQNIYNNNKKLKYKN